MDENKCCIFLSNKELFVANMNTKAKVKINIPTTLTVVGNADDSRFKIIYKCIDDALDLSRIILQNSALPVKISLVPYKKRILKSGAKNEKK